MQSTRSSFLKKETKQYTYLSYSRRAHVITYILRDWACFDGYVVFYGVETGLQPPALQGKPPTADVINPRSGSPPIPDMLVGHREAGRNAGRISAEGSRKLLGGNYRDSSSPLLLGTAVPGFPFPETKIWYIKVLGSWILQVHSF